MQSELDIKWPSYLFWEFLRLIKAPQPRTVLAKPNVVAGSGTLFTVVIS